MGKREQQRERRAEAMAMIRNGATDEEAAAATGLSTKSVELYRQRERILRTKRGRPELPTVEATNEPDATRQP